MLVAAGRVSDAFVVTKLDRLTAIRPDRRDVGTSLIAHFWNDPAAPGTELDGLLLLSFNIGGHPPAE
jgi:hypothetical protein